jgi:tetratricopeptide (TPR) repeat protein
VQQFRIIPNRAGTFVIPEIDVVVDGQTETIQAQEIVVTEGESLGLIDIEIVGDDTSIFVGQSVSLGLDLFVRMPDDHRDLVNDKMIWRSISSYSDWGVFQNEIDTMASNRQYPGGSQVLREDDEGERNGFYKFSITTTVTPTRSGPIDNSEIRIIVDYPVQIVKSRDPFGDFGRSPFGNNSSIQQLLNGSLIPGLQSNGYEVQQAVSAQAKASVTLENVRPIPTKDRPADFRGAVGESFQLQVVARNTSVAAGDPITVNIALGSDSNLEKVVPPPIASLSEWTREFLVSQQPLAGFVTQNRKIFTTTVRPRTAGLSELPAIPYSYFNPIEEKFETIYSEPIPIDVSEAESLSLDSIVGNRAGDDSSPELNTEAEVRVPPRLTNFSADEILSSAPTIDWQRTLSLAFIAPPVCWLAVAFCRLLIAKRESFQTRASAKRAAVRSIQSSNSAEQAVEPLLKFGEWCLLERSQERSSLEALVGRLRSHHHYPLAANLESLFEKVDSVREQNLTNIQNEALGLIEELDSVAGSPMGRTKAFQQNRRKPSSKRITMSILIIVFSGLASACTTQLASATDVARGIAPKAIEGELATEDPPKLQLSESQQRTILTEANRDYERAREESDAAISKQLYRAAADKYQQLVTGGMNDWRVYFNAGNAYSGSGELGRALAAFEIANRRSPGNEPIQASLRAVEQRLATRHASDQATSSNAMSANETDTAGDTPLWEPLLRIVSNSVGRHRLILVLILSSLTMWLLLIARLWPSRLPLARLAILPAIILGAAGSIYVPLIAMENAEPIAIVVDSDFSIFKADNELSPIIESQSNGEGTRLTYLGERAGWIRVETQSGDATKGWIRSDAAVLVP